MVCFMNSDQKLNKYSGFNGFLLFFDLETIGMDEASDHIPMVSKSIKTKKKQVNPLCLFKIRSEFI